MSGSFNGAPEDEENYWKRRIEDAKRDDLKDLADKIEAYNKRKENLLVLADGCIYIKEYDKALEYLKECLKMDPTNSKAKGLEKEVQEKKTQQTVKALLEEAERYEETEEYDKALKCLEKCLKLDPTNSRAKALQTEIKTKRGLSDGAKAGIWGAITVVVLLGFVRFFRL